MPTTLDLSVDQHIRSTVNSKQLQISRESFLERGFALVSYLIPDDVKRLVAREVEELLNEQSVRRDLRIPQTDDTPRFMRNVAADDIRSRNGAIVELYGCDAFRNALTEVASEPVLECPYEPEHYVITHLDRPGDTHGWHWDDYSFGVIFVLESPAPEKGGFVQTVPNTRWNKSDPAVFRKIIANPIYSYELKPHDIYLLRTDTTLHRVHPLESDARRTIINFAYAGARDYDKEIAHETMEDLFHR